MDEASPTYEELKKKLAEAEKIIAALSGNSQEIPGESGSDILKERRPASRKESKLIEAYIKSEENFRNTLDASPLGVRVIGEDGQLSYANQAILDITGYESIEELKAVPRNKFYTPEGYAIHLGRLEKQMRGEYIPADYEIDIQRKDGEVRTLQVFRRDIKWGGQLQTMMMYLDITDRLKLEAANRYQANLAQNTPDAIISADNNLKIVSWNKGAEQMYGWREEEVMGKTITEALNPGHLMMPHEQFTQILNETGSWRGEDIHRRKDGQQFPVLMSVSLIKDRNGKEIGAVTITKDITEQKKTEENLAALNNRHKAILAAIPDIIMEVDNNKIYTWANPAGIEFFGEDVIGKEASWYFEGEQKTYEAVNSLFRGDENTFYVESWQRRRDGKKRLLAWWCRALKDKEGRVTGALSTARDITERTEAEQALKESQETFFNTFHSSPSGNVIISLQTMRISQVNDALCRASGYSREELEGKNVLDQGFWFDPELRDELFNELMQKGTISSKEVKLRMKTGDSRFFITHIAVLTLKNEPFIYASMVDITDRKKAEEALQASEERYRTSLENMMEGCQIIDRDWRYVYLNDAAVQQGRRKRSELLGHTMMEMYPGIEKTDMFAVLKKCMEKRIAYRIENEFTFTDGSSGWFDLSIQPVPEGIFILSLDISERHQAEMAIHESEERFRRIFQAGPLGIVLSSLDYKFTIANERFCQLYGYTEKELTGMNFKAFSFPEDIDANIANLQKLASNQIPYYSTEKRYKRKDGSVFWGSLTVTLLRDNEGKAQGYLVMVQDITSRKENEARINHLNLTLRSIRNVNQLITREKDRDRLIQGICDSMVATGSFENAWIVLVDDTHQPLALAQSNSSNFSSVNLFKNGELPFCAQKALKGKKVIIIEDPYTQCKDCPALKEKRNIGSMAVRLESEDEIYGVLCASVSRELLSNEDEKSLFKEVADDIAFALRDISLREASELLQQEQFRAAKLESIGTLAGGIAHDFNNLLTGIMGNIGLAKSFLPPSGDVFEVLDEAEKAAARSRDLTQQLLTFARGGKPIKKIINTKKVIKDSAVFALRGSKVRLEVDLPDDLWLVEADEGQISQVVHNLVINADEAMPNGGMLYITGKNVKLPRNGGLPLTRGNYVEINIRDTGTGIAPEDLQKIFEPYFTTKQQGSGLGLTSAYSIIKSHGGSLLVESSLNEGSTFRIYLPASKKTAKGEKKVAAKQSTQAGGKVLIMDDDEIIRKMLKNMLNLAGYEVEAAADGAEALEKYKQAMAANNTFSAVIMDLTVPGGMGGKEAIKELMEIDPKAAVIVSSGYATDPIMSEYKKYGFSAVIAKPYSIGQLQETITSVTANKKK